MSSTGKPPPRTPFKHSTSNNAPTSSFLQQRDALVGEIAIVGNEFGAVEALWSQFENVMAKEPGQGEEGGAERNGGAEEEEDDEHQDGSGDGNVGEESN
ncbi:MAG: hypothetical protein Q9225_004664 [Loekoesia sp. 1 TL-2023]